VDQVDCASFAKFGGDGYMQWGPITNNYANFTCVVTCKNTISSCPFILCEIYTTQEQKAGHNQTVASANQTTVALA
jgi:hypothetical protein